MANKSKTVSVYLRKNRDNYYGTRLLVYKSVPQFNKRTTKVTETDGNTVRVVSEKIEDVVPSNHIASLCEAFSKVLPKFPTDQTVKVDITYTPTSSK